jgi:hypothetical protein
MDFNCEVISTTILWISALVSASILIGGFIWLQVYTLKSELSNLKDEAYIERIQKSRSN